LERIFRYEDDSVAIIKDKLVNAQAGGKVTFNDTNGNNESEENLTLNLTLNDSNDDKRNIRNVTSTNDLSTSSKSNNNAPSTSNEPYVELSSPTRRITRSMTTASTKAATVEPLYISLDIETGGENSGIIQPSAQIFRMVQHNSKLTSEIERECFDEYVRPSNVAIWDENLFQIHGLHRDHPRIKEADNITAISRQFCAYMKFNTSRSLAITLFLTCSFIL